MTPVAARDLLIGAIALIGAALIARPWLRSTALAAIAGFMGMVVTSSFYESHGPGQWLMQIALGWFLGVVAGSLLGVVVFRIRAKESLWRMTFGSSLSRHTVWSFCRWRLLWRSYCCPVDSTELIEVITP